MGPVQRDPVVTHNPIVPQGQATPVVSARPSPRHQSLITAPWPRSRSSRWCGTTVGAAHPALSSPFFWCFSPPWSSTRQSSGGHWRVESWWTWSVTWFSFVFQSEEPSGTRCPAAFKNSCCCARWGDTRILLVRPEGWGVPAAPGHGLSFLFPPQKVGNSPQKSPLGDKQGLCQGGIASGRWWWTSGLILGAGDPPDALGLVKESLGLALLTTQSWANTSVSGQCPKDLHRLYTVSESIT